jgi:predicted TPR repeat methyltransferase
VSADQARLQQAQSLLAQGRGEQALALLATTPIDEKTGEALFLRAAAAARAGQSHVCREALDACLRRMPAHPGALFQRAVMDLAGGDREAARAGFAAAVDAVPSFAAAHYNLGVLQAESGELEAAEASYASALRAQPDLMQAANNLANLLIGRGQWQSAVELLQPRLEAQPGFAIGWCSLGRALLAGERLAQAEAALQRALALDPRQPAALDNLGEVQLRQQRPEQAREAFEAAQALAPQSPERAFKLAALRGETPPRPPEAFVRKLFDDMADGFEERLIEGLGYRFPLELEPLLPQADALDVLDLGCGTGLAAPALRPRARRLEGVDLSARMLDHARARALYDALHEASLLDYLRSQPAASWDLLVAADVFIYVGELGPVFEQARRVLRVGGCLLGSLECPQAPVEAGYVLQPSGRYAHLPAYAESLARGCGFEVDLSQPLPLRREHGQMLAGWLLRLRVPA